MGSSLVQLRLTLLSSQAREVEITKGGGSMFVCSVSWREMTTRGWNTFLDRHNLGIGFTISETSLRMGRETSWVLGVVLA